jgi:putative Ig domain-containing protein/matrixin/fibronectin type III domain protein/Ig-like domain-containing protein
MAAEATGSILKECSLMKRFISKPAAQAFVLLLAVLFMAKTGVATTASMLSDQQLIASSRVIILGDVQSVKSQWDLRHENINSYIKVKVAKTLKGELQNQSIVFKQLGGTVGEDSTVIFGALEFKVGQRVLLFLDTASDGTLRVAHLFQGKYDVSLDAGAGTPRVKRNLDKGDINILGAADGANITNNATLKRFTRKINRVLRDNAAEVAAFAAERDAAPIVEIPPEYIDDATGSQPGDVTAEYTFLGSFRWFEPDTGLPVFYRVNPTGSPTPNGGNTEINQALAAWTNVQTTSLVLQNGGSTTVFGFKSDGVSAISYNDPLDQMSDPVGCSGVLAIGGVSSAGGGTRVIGGISFSHIFEGDVVFNRNFQCFLGISANLAEVATHEIGHSIGFGHSPDVNAIMYASAHGNGRGPTLGSDDIAAVSFLYPGSKGGPPPAPPASPGALTASAASTSAINLSWADNSNNESGFRLERKTGVSGAYSLIATLPANQTGYSDTGLAAATTYYYRVKAFNNAGESGYSNEAFATTNSATASNNSAFVSQSVPSSLQAGQAATVSVTMRNTGSTTWFAGSYFLGSQNPADNTIWGLNRVGLAASVAPGAQTTFTFTITAPVAAGAYNFQWRMLQQGVASFGAFTPNVAVTVSSSTPPPTTLTITTTSLAPITRGVPYSQQLSATGGSPPYTWSLISGALPAGLSLSSSGLISGTPTVGGGYSFTVMVRDSHNSTASKIYKLALR